MEDPIQNILLGTIIGDALGTGFDGLKKHHIRAVFKTLDSFTDPEPALKGRMERWKKPGLYSSISQFMLLTAIFSQRKKKIDDLLVLLSECIKKMPEINDTGTFLFRNPDTAEKSFILNSRKSNVIYPVNSYPCARMCAITAPLAFSRKPLDRHIIDIIQFVSQFTIDTATIAGSLLYNTFLRETAPAGGNYHKNLIDRLCSLNIDLIESLKRIPHIIFELKINPDSLSESQEVYGSIFDVIKSAGSRENAEKAVCTIANRHLKNTVTRGTVNHPYLILPYTFFLCADPAADPSKILFEAVLEGGTTSVLCALAGGICSALFGKDSIPEALLQGLVNKNRILSLISTISQKKMPDSIIDDFIKTEQSLTIKEIDERNARLKHIKKKKKTPDYRKKSKDDLAKHIVESWTKLDKAKWKKERKRKDE